MVYNTENTDWPAFDISTAGKELISRFFSLLDTESEEVGNTLADEVFVPNGRAEFGGRFFTGTEEIRKSRDNAWKVISRRRHKLIKVYSASINGEDLLFIGHVEMGFRNGNSVEGEFAGRLVIEGATSDSPKLALYQVWADSAPVARALKGE